MHFDGWAVNPIASANPEENLVQMNYFRTKSPSSVNYYLVTDGAETPEDARAVVHGYRSRQSLVPAGSLRLLLGCARGRDLRLSDGGLRLLKVGEEINLWEYAKDIPDFVHFDGWAVNPMRSGSRPPSQRRRPQAASLARSGPRPPRWVPIPSTA